jgi:asparagine synthase (glutamine-hydrolysing)
MALVDMQSYLPGDILTKVDRCSMSVSLEARVPMLDHVLAEFAIALPATLKLRGRRGKWVLRKVLADLLPPQLTDRPKQGFAVPLCPWFRGRLRHRLSSLLDRKGPLQDFVDPAGVATLVHEHLARRRDNSSMLWRLLALDKWLEAVDTGLLARSPAPPPIEDLLGER